MGKLFPKMPYHYIPQISNKSALIWTSVQLDFIFPVLGHSFKLFLESVVYKHCNFEYMLCNPYPQTPECFGFWNICID